MTRWKELPAGLDESERQLVAQLRRLKDRAGLSLAALAAKTSYSSSSWERYLNGKKPVPRGAAEELAEVCGAPVERVLVLHEVAETARAQRPGTPAEEEPPPRRARRSWWPPRTAQAVAGAAVLAAFAAGFLTGAAWHGDDDTAAPAGASPSGSASAFAAGHAYHCGRIHSEHGTVTAGYSVTREVLLDRGSSGWEVVEAQCLLQHKGFGSGRIDGLYGEATAQAARAFQKKQGLVPDGIVGPDTWRELRR
jgi:transcriptional regulator with XRE-family HTH domain